jgi:hypothetical protein
VFQSAGRIIGPGNATPIAQSKRRCQRFNPPGGSSGLGTWRVCHVWDWLRIVSIRRADHRAWEPIRSHALPDALKRLGCEHLVSSGVISLLSGARA